MHLEILIEDSSGGRLLGHLLPKLLGPNGANHSWKLHSYNGIGRIPKNLLAGSDPSKRILLDRLPALLRGYGNTPGIDAILVVVDTDKRDCATFLTELRAVADVPGAHPRVMFRLAIEEVEAWYLGDRAALLKAYPRIRSKVLDAYVQDSAGGTWELLASAIPSIADRSAGQIKHEWADKIGPLLNLESNRSLSFCKFRDGIRRLIDASHAESALPAPS